MNNEKHLKNIYYITVPETFNLNIDSFALDKMIKLPIETDGLENWDSNKLTWEIIISAMLKLMAYDKENVNLPYYRDFIKAVRPNIIEELTDSAIFKSNEKEFNLAKEIFLAIDGLDSDNDRNLLNLVVLIEDEADWYKAQDNISKYDELIAESLRMYSELLNQEHVLTDVYFNAAYFFIKVRDFEKAEICLTSFIEYSDDDEKKAKAKQLLTEYKNVLGNEDIFNSAYKLILEEHEYEAIKILTDFLENNDHVWNAWFLLGWSNRRLSNFSEAVSSLEKAISLNKKDIDTYNEIAICYMELGDFSKSKESLVEALKLNPEDVKIISNMGIIELKQGKTDEAKRYFETVLVYEPEDSIAKHYLDQIIQ